MARAILVTSEIETFPEADRLDGFAHPRETARLFGHAQAEAELAAALTSGQIHHAWLIGGREGAGKATLAYRFARAALAHVDEKDLFGGLDIAPDTPTARQVRALAHPGLLLLRRGYDPKTKRLTSNISVDEVRRLRPFLGLSGEAEGHRVVIVDSADDLNINAANALLKSLEEPPPRTVFLILSSAPARLLPTIRSRCRTLALNPLSSEDLRAAVRQAFEAAELPVPAESGIAALDSVADGSVRRMLLLLGGDGLALLTRIDAIFDSLPKLDPRAAHALADELQPVAAEQKFDLFLDLFSSRLSRLIRAAATGSGAEGEAELAARVIGANRLATFATLWETLARGTAESLALNLDRKSLILSMLWRLEAASTS